MGQKTENPERQKGGKDKDSFAIDEREKMTPWTASWEEGPRAEGHTHICFVRQLPCLYPFPQRSHLSSVADRFPSPLIKCEPSLARRPRFFVLTGLEAVAEEVVVPSTAVF